MYCTGFCKEWPLSSAHISLYLWVFNTKHCTVTCIARLSFIHSISARILIPAPPVVAAVLCQPSRPSHLVPTPVPLITHQPGRSCMLPSQQCSDTFIRLGNPKATRGIHVDSRLADAFYSASYGTETSIRSFVMCIVGDLANILLGDNVHEK